MKADVPGINIWLVFAGGLIILTLLRACRNLLPGHTPPVFEGIPFIGGILKFSKVMPQLWLSQYLHLGQVLFPHQAELQLQRLLQKPDINSQMIGSTQSNRPGIQKVWRGLHSSSAAQKDHLLDWP